MTAPKLEYRIRLVLEQREPDESLVWREAGVSQMANQGIPLNTEWPEKLFHHMNKPLKFIVLKAEHEIELNWKLECR